MSHMTTTRAAALLLYLVGDTLNRYVLRHRERMNDDRMLPPSLVSTERVACLFQNKMLCIV